MDIVKGEINSDKLEDMVVVTENLCSEGEAWKGDYNRCRTVFLIVQTKPNGYEIKASNKVIIECSDCGGGGVGDPYQKPLIEKGKITFLGFYGAWEKTWFDYTFTYNKAKKDWFLSNCGYCSYKMGDSECKGREKTPKDFGIINFANFKRIYF